MMTVDDAIALATEPSRKKCGCLDCEAAKILVKEIFELRERLRIAESVRDDARASSQRYLDEMRELKAKVNSQ